MWLAHAEGSCRFIALHARQATGLVVAEPAASQTLQGSVAPYTDCLCTVNPRFPFFKKYAERGVIAGMGSSGWSEDFDRWRYHPIAIYRPKAAALILPSIQKKV